MNDQTVSLLAYADGACKNNNSHSKKRLGGCGFIIARENSDLIQKYIDTESTDICSLRNEILQSKQFTCMAVPLSEKIEPPNKFSNNRAELEAFNGVLAHVLLFAEKEKKRISITIKVDSEYVIKVFNGAWNWRNNDWKLASGTVAANIDYANETICFTEALKRRNHTIKVVHVTAHQTEPKKDIQEKWIDWFYNDFADRLSNLAAQVETDINYNQKKRKRQDKK